MKRNGLTFGEMLVVMVVIAVIAVAVAPLMMPKKMKKDTSKVPHGIFECYYQENENGGYTLMQYYADNKDNKNAQPTAVVGGTSCTFNVPDANYYKLQAIGAGGNGSDAAVTYDVNTEDITEGSVNITQLATLPQEVKDNWPSGGIQTSVEITSSYGKGGEPYCRQAFHDDRKECDICNTDTAACPEECKYIQNLSGGDSGYTTGGTLTIPNLLASDNISYTQGGSNNYQDTTFTYNDITYTFTPAYPGGDADLGIPGTKGTNSQVSPISSFFNIQPTYAEGGTCVAGTTYSRPAGDGQDAQITFRIGDQEPGEIIEYKFYNPQINLTLGNNGEHAQESHITYPDLKGILRITPGFVNNNQGGGTTTITQGNRILLQSNVGTAGDGTIEQILDSNDIVAGNFPSNYAPKNRTPGFYPEYSISNINDTGLTSQLDGLGYVPGSAGYGNYPYINVVNYRRSSIIAEIQTTEEEEALSIQQIKCLDGSDPLGPDNNKYCKGEAGRPGAVRIVW